jgi:predicted AAA+ superfamily ATPase
MLEQEIQRKIGDFRELGLPAYIPRDGQVHILPEAVSTLVGARRSGKSYRSMQVAGEMIKNGFLPSIKHVCALDFDNPILSSMTATDLPLIQKVFFKINPDFSLTTPIIFILDEIHKIQGWENYVIDLSRNRNWRVVVTGSSSKMLHGDVATELRGKSISTFVYPLTFKEFYRFHDLKRLNGSTVEEAAAMRLFDEFLQWGAFPVIPSTPCLSKETVLRHYFDTMILRDIIQRHEISKPGACMAALRHSIANIAKPFTVKSLTEFVKTAGYPIGRESIGEYLKYAEDAWLLFLVPLHTASSKEVERNYKKVYCIDWGLAQCNSTVWDGARSRALENTVFLYLKQRYSRVAYYLTREKRQEVDFIAVNSEGKVAAVVQVSMDISNPQTLKREIEPLAATAKYFGCKENVIVTYNQEKLFPAEQVRAVPAWRWMLE